LGCISKGIALCGKGQLCHAMEAFDLAFTFATHDSMTIDLLLLIKVLFTSLELVSLSLSLRLFRLLRFSMQVIMTRQSGEFKT
jgi:hypothetical protein